MYEFSAWQATLRVEQVMKGRASTKEIIVEFPGPRGGEGAIFRGPLTVLEHLNPGERVVVYLSSKEGGQVHSFADPYRSAVRLGESERVTQLLHSPLGQGGVDEHVASLIAASMKAASRATIEQSVLDLVDLKGSEAASALKAALGHSNDTAIRAVILEGLLRVGDYSELRSAIETVSAVESDRFAAGTQMVLAARIGLVDDPELVREYYYPLLKHRKDFVRRSAAYAIRKARLKEAVPYLIEGLQDGDADTRYQCMMALAEILGRGGAWAPSKERFEESEGEYIGRWQGWWKSSGQFEFRTPADEDVNEGESSSSEALSPPGPREASAARGDGGGKTADVAVAFTPSIDSERNALFPTTGRQASPNREASGDEEVSGSSELEKRTEGTSRWSPALLAIVVLAVVAIGGVFVIAVLPRGRL